MHRNSLLVAPELKNTNKYLESGTRTEITDIISKKAKILKDRTDGLTVRKILVWMNKHTSRLHDGSDSRKFKRSATEILQSMERTGCCDSCTLFTALARSVGIPTMQIITLSKRWGKEIDEGRKTATSGHFFASVYLKDIHGKFGWTLVDPDKYVTDIRDVRFSPLKIEDRNMGDLYTFAYVTDYFDDLGIDSIGKMAEVQLEAYKKCDKRDFKNEYEIDDR